MDNDLLFEAEQTLYKLDSSWTPYQAGDEHPQGWTRVEIQLSQANLRSEGSAMDFNWDILPEEDSGTRIIAYRLT